MIVNKVKKNKNFTIVDNGYLNDPNLSFKAKGILTYLLSLPGDWVIYFEEVITHSKDGIKSFRSGVDELINEGYIYRYPVRENGVIIRWETEIYEVKKPLSQNVEVAEVNIIKEKEESNQLLNTNNTHTYASNNLNNYNSFAKITEAWNNLSTLVVPIDSIYSDVKRTINLTKLIEKYEFDDVLATINKIESSKYAQRFVINFDWFLDEKNYLRVKVQWLSLITRYNYYKTKA
mgnify:FL=1